MDRALSVAADSGLITEGEPLLVLLSGGPDSVCLVDVARRLDATVSALHVNYGLREDAEDDEAHCRALCSSLEVPLTVERAWLASTGNLQANARDARYRLAERHASGDYAAAHTASDQAETVIYRLAVSPGRRALLGMEPRRGRLVRPLLGATRDETQSYCRARGLTWREDVSNTDQRFARARVRAEIMPALRTLSPAAERTIAETARLLRDEAEVLDSAVSDTLSALGGGPAVELSALADLPRAVVRLALRSLAEEAFGGDVSISRSQADSVLGLGQGGGSASLDLGDGLRAVVEYGTLRFRRGGEAPVPEPVELGVPGVARFGTWEVEASVGSPSAEVALAPDAVRGPLVVRSWQEGDRMRPVGLGGAKSLQDLFTDRKVPRALRRLLPVVCVNDEVAWVAGVALDERFAAGEDRPDSIGLSARRV